MNDLLLLTIQDTAVSFVMISSPLQSINLSISEIGASAKTIASLPDQKSRYHIDQIFVQVFFPEEKTYVTFING